ncbi:MAG: response regulator [Phycisphaeraceae bacterium]|nr:response regulator [Phycisphaeraceae bacterium]
MFDTNPQRDHDRLERCLRAARAGAFEILLPSRAVRFGVSLRSLLGADAQSLPDAIESLEARIHPEDLDRVRSMLDEQARAPGPFVVEFRARNAAGRFVWMVALGEGQRLEASRAWSAAEGESQGGAANGAAAAASTIRVSGIVQAAHLRPDSSHERRAAPRASFLAAMSHEIRTPMTAILGFADLLREAATPDAVATAAEAIHRNGEHLLRIVNDVLDLSRIEAGAMTLEEIAVSPVDLSLEVCEAFEPRARETGVELRVELLGPVPSLIRTDPTRVRQILFNLVDNALKFTERGFVRLGLERGPGESIRFHVSDTGMGVTEEQIGRIFRPFTQGDATTPRRFGGSGLGLDISRRLARMLGGDITVRSTPGRGSTFTVEISSGPLAGVPEVTSIEPRRAGRHRAPSPSLRVLLAEDGADNQRLLRHHLEREGMSVVAVSDGAAALEVATAADRRGQPFDLALVDMQMPRLDGLGATRALRDSGFRGPIIVLTAHDVAGAREACLAAGSSEVLAKPIERHQLLESIRRHLERAGA